MGIVNVLAAADNLVGYVLSNELTVCAVSRGLDDSPVSRVLANPELIGQIVAASSASSCAAPVLVLQGPRSCGLTQILQCCAARLQVLGESCRVIALFDYDSVPSLLWQLLNALGDTDLAGATTQTPAHHLACAVAAALVRAAALSPLVILIDSIAGDGEPVQWLPSPMPHGCRIVLATRLGSVTHPMISRYAGALCRLSLANPTRAEARALVEGSGLTKAQLDELMSDEFWGPDARAEYVRRFLLGMAMTMGVDPDGWKLGTHAEVAEKAAAVLCVGETAGMSTDALIDRCIDMMSVPYDRAFSVAWLHLARDELLATGSLYEPRELHALCERAITRAVASDEEKVSIRVQTTSSADAPQGALSLKDVHRPEGTCSRIELSALVGARAPRQMMLWLLTVRPRGWSEAKLLRVAGADVAHLEDLRPLLDPTAAAVGSVALRSVVADGVRRRWLCSSERWLEDGAQRTLEILAAELAEQVARECYAADAETRRQCIERRVDAAPCFIIERALLEAAVHATLGARLPDEPQDDELARAVWHQWQVHRLIRMVQKVGTVLGPWRVGYGTWCMMQGPVFKDCETECARLKSVVRVSLLSPAVLRTLLRPASTRQLRLMVLALGDRPVDASWLATAVDQKVDPLPVAELEAAKAEAAARLAAEQVEQRAFLEARLVEMEAIQAESTASFQAAREKMEALAIELQAEKGAEVAVAAKAAILEHINAKEADVEARVAASNGQLAATWVLMQLTAEEGTGADRLVSRASASASSPPGTAYGQWPNDSAHWQLSAQLGAFCSELGLFSEARTLLLEARTALGACACAGGASDEIMGGLLLDLAQNEVRHWDSLRRWEAHELTLLLESSAEAVARLRRTPDGAVRSVRLASALSRRANGCFKIACVVDAPAREQWLAESDQATAEARRLLEPYGDSYSLGSSCLVRAVTQLVRLSRGIEDELAPPTEALALERHGAFEALIEQLEEAGHILRRSVGVVCEPMMFVHANLSEVHLMVWRTSLILAGTAGLDRTHAIAHHMRSIEHLGAACEVAIAHFGTTDHPNVRMKLGEYQRLLSATLGPGILGGPLSALAQCRSRLDIRRIRESIHHLFANRLLEGSLNVGGFRMIDLGDLA